MGTLVVELKACLEELTGPLRQVTVRRMFGCDAFLARGKCLNIGDAAERSTCTQQAAADAKDALASCSEQDHLRHDVCDRLDSAPYAPVIDPTPTSVSTLSARLR